MQNAALAALGLGDEWSYEAIEVAPADFAAKVREMAAGDFAGANVTVPHKEAALALADAWTAVAEEIGAANTLVFAAGKVEAHNTDADGFLAALPFDPRGRRALVLGAGGAARAVIWALDREGAEVEVWNRTASRAERICEGLGGKAVAGPEQGTYDLIVNTSAAGLHGEDPFETLPLVPGLFLPDQVVVDMVYGAAPSRLLRSAEDSGATVVDGIEILVHQGALSLGIWIGREAPIDVMRAAARG
jgi:shikimate dehydrogenase